MEFLSQLRNFFTLILRLDDLQAYIPFGISCGLHFLLKELESFMVYLGIYHELILLASKRGHHLGMYSMHYFCMQVIKVTPGHVYFGLILHRGNKLAHYGFILYVGKDIFILQRGKSGHH